MSAVIVTPRALDVSTSNNPNETDNSPVKSASEFRDYSASNPRVLSRVESFYLEQHQLQTYEFAGRKLEEYSKLNHFQLSIWECLEWLDTLVDNSDPDTDVSQMQHALQTAEAIRKAYPQEEFDWFPLTGLIHDLGKILSSACNEPQAAVVGDTHIVGCKFSEYNVFPQYFQCNADFHDPIYSTEYGVYKPNCGLDQVRMSFSHDEYLYRVLIGNSQVKLPESALYIIRFHSFYPWHKYGAYKHLTNSKDENNLKWVLEFNKFDLYSKSNPKVNVKEVKQYYEKLIQKYMPGKLNW